MPGERRAISSHPTVDISTVPKSDYLNQQPIIVHLIDDSVAPHPNPVDVLLALQRYASRGAGFLGKQVDSGADALLFLAGKLGEHLGGPPSDLDLVGRSQASPRSALTSSQGT